MCTFLFWNRYLTGTLEEESRSACMCNVTESEFVRIFLVKIAHYSIFSLNEDGFAVLGCRTLQLWLSFDWLDVTFVTTLRYCRDPFTLIVQYVVRLEPYRFPVNPVNFRDHVSFLLLFSSVLPQCFGDVCSTADPKMRFLHFRVETAERMSLQMPS